MFFRLKKNLEKNIDSIKSLTTLSDSHVLEIFDDDFSQYLQKNVMIFFDSTGSHLFPDQYKNVY